MGIGENIKKLRKQHNMEQKDLAKKLNISDKTVSSWERDRTEPKIGMIEKMCEVFDCEKTEIIGGELSSSDVFLIEVEKRSRLLSVDDKQNVIQYMDFILKKE